MWVVLSFPSVLILVLVEHTLGGVCIQRFGLLEPVLILVLVEHTLGGSTGMLIRQQSLSLNPCFSGTYSRSVCCDVNHCWQHGLNPCFSGTYSRRVGGW